MKNTLIMFGAALLSSLLSDLDFRPTWRCSQLGPGPVGLSTRSDMTYHAPTRGAGTKESPLEALPTPGPGPSPGRRSAHSGPANGSDSTSGTADQCFGTGAEKEHFPFGLTRSEMSVARLVSEGLTNNEIAVRLALSIHTVDSHARSSFTKVNANNRVELARAIIFYECDMDSDNIHPG